MMESTTSDSGKKVFFYCFTNKLQRLNFDHSLNSRPVEFLNVFCFLIQTNLDLRNPMHFSFLTANHIWFKISAKKSQILIIPWIPKHFSAFQYTKQCTLKLSLFYAFSYFFGHTLVSTYAVFGWWAFWWQNIFKFAVNNLFVTSKIEFSISPILEFKVLLKSQRAF